MILYDPSLCYYRVSSILSPYRSVSRCSGDSLVGRGVYTYSLLMRDMTLLVESGQAN
jgi:hypothetical protein